MAYARVALYTVRPGTLDGILTKAEAELVPQMRQQPGFRRNFTVRTGADTLVAVTVWDDEARAKQADEHLSAWARTEMGPSLVTFDNHMGELVISSVPTGEISGYARVALWRFQPGTADSVAERVRNEMLPQMEREPGFVGYGAARTGSDSAISVSVSASREQSRAAAERIAPWLSDQLGASIASVERHEGEIVWGVRAS